MTGLILTVGAIPVLACVLVPLIQRDLRNAPRRRARRMLVLDRAAIVVRITADAAKFATAMSKAVQEAAKLDTALRRCSEPMRAYGRTAATS